MPNQRFSQCQPAHLSAADAPCEDVTDTRVCTALQLKLLKHTVHLPVHAEGARSARIRATNTQTRSLQCTFRTLDSLIRSTTCRESSSGRLVLTVERWSCSAITSTSRTVRREKCLHKYQHTTAHSTNKKQNTHAITCPLDRRTSPGYEFWHHHVDDSGPPRSHRCTTPDG